MASDAAADLGLDDPTLAGERSGGIGHWGGGHGGRVTLNRGAVGRSATVPAAGIATGIAATLFAAIAALEDAQTGAIREGLEETLVGNNAAK